MCAERERERGDDVYFVVNVQHPKGPVLKANNHVVKAKTNLTNKKLAENQHTLHGSIQYSDGHVTPH